MKQIDEKNACSVQIFCNQIIFLTQAFSVLL